MREMKLTFQIIKSKKTKNKTKKPQDKQKNCIYKLVHVTNKLAAPESWAFIVSLLLFSD